MQLLINLHRVDRLVELCDGLLEPVLAQLAFQGIYRRLRFFVLVVPLRILSGLDGRIAVILDLLDILCTLFNELEKI